MNIDMTMIMPSYNRGEFIEEAIKSVLMQKVSFTYKLVIADDASTDDSVKIAKKYMAEFPDKIEVVTSEKNQGLLANCIRIYERLKSKYFCIVDADDYYIDDKFMQKAYDFLEENQEYTIYGSNTKILKDGVFIEDLYHTNCEKEMTVRSIEELYTGKGKYITNTLETVFRNVIFSEGVPAMIKEMIGTLSEPTFRGDLGRYIAHLKYGYAKFVDETVCVYRINEKGLWSCSNDFHRNIMGARGQIDYCKYYNGCNKENFYSTSYAYIDQAIASLLKMTSSRECDKIDVDDLENLKEVIEELKGVQKVEYNYDDRLVELMKNVEHRKIIVWGTGPSSKYLIEKYLHDKDITYFVDGYEDRQGKYIDNTKVLSPAELKELKDTNKYVIIASAHYNEIIEEILKWKFCKEDEIMNLYKMDVKYSLLFE